MAEELNIYQKLAKIRKPVEILQKNKDGYGYKYVTEDVILSKITGLMDKLGVSLVPNIVGGTTQVEPYSYTKTKSTRDGKIYEDKVNEILVHCDMEWHWVNNDKPEDRVIVPWAMVGQQSDASQAFGSGLSYASRYFMLKYFNVATSDDDPDNWRNEQKRAENSENREIATQIIEQVHELVVNYLEVKPDDKATVATVVKKYAKSKNGKASANYYDIEDPVVAGNLLKEITEKFSIDKEK
ncbi:MAG: ERF family protein [Ruminococcus sp.]|nr:ERF family protein [Ruminococcus sp.]